MSQEVLPKTGGMMTLIDLYYYYNRIRGKEVVSPDDILQATQCFPSFNSAVKLEVVGDNLKVVKLLSFSDEQDYERTIKPLISKS
jgi:ESCRT-II complex subunit VPS36